MKKLVALVFVFAQVLVSCSSSDDSASVGTAYLIKRAVANGITFEYSYSNGTNKMVSFTASGQLQTYEYTGNLITKTSRYLYDPSVVDYETTYEYDENQKLIAETFIDYHSMTTSRKVFTYNADDTVSYQGYSGNIGNPTANGLTGIIYLNSNGEPYKVEEFSNGNLLFKKEFTYDDKNSVFKNVAGFNKLLTMYDTGKTNNLLTSRTYDGNGVLVMGYTNSYVYNSGNFPDELTTTQNTGSSTTTNYFYW
ncbi:hypothetical protein LZZ90_03845 [Flavobacterium sp. SM15]|uniref:hypothetical protein n=1 Tax=Flavobacterium sp. SM15 TaxID=2908005 RepID=UPI001EDA2F75|nr:hypothetical protein [Flavobacterium sp. SM15]MCG2610635.1 hypothetical protein [Flavobacterium sp. SM15]